MNILAFTNHEWAAFGMGMTVMLVLCILAVGFILRRWEKVPPAEFREKPPEHWNCRCAPAEADLMAPKGATPAATMARRTGVARPDSEGEALRVPDSPPGEIQATKITASGLVSGRITGALTEEDRDRMMRGRWPDSSARKPIESAIFVFVPTDGRETDPAWRGTRRTLIDYSHALRMLCAQYVTEDTGKQVQKLEDIADGRAGCVSVIGGMVERPLKIGQSSPSRPLPPAGRDGGSPLRNHREAADDPGYVRQCLTNAMMAEDFAAWTGRIPELFAFRTAPGERGRLLTRKQAEEMAGRYFPREAAADVVASLARGASDFIGLGTDGAIRRYEPAS